MSDKLYEKILNILLTLRDVREHFHTYSAQDIKRLIDSKMAAKMREPKALAQLYELEKLIANLRETFTEAKDERAANIILDVTNGSS